MDDLSSTLQNSPHEVAEAEKKAESAHFRTEQTYAIAFLRAREEYPSIEDAKQAAKLDPDYQEARGEEITSVANYKELGNKQINARKLSDLTKGVL